jgi:hypothetical protein
MVVIFAQGPDYGEESLDAALGMLLQRVVGNHAASVDTLILLVLCDRGRLGPAAV